jgi:hypothetical protein
LSKPETPGLQTGDSGVHSPETLGLGPETPAQVFGPVFRGVSLFPVMGAETYPGIFGRKVSLAGDSAPGSLSPESPVSGPRRLRPKKAATASHPLRTIKRLLQPQVKAAAHTLSPPLLPSFKALDLHLLPIELESL